jgi:hypothetical protein
MSAHYRLIQFMLDPFSGARVPIAALVRGADGRVSVARAPHVPGPHCVGGRATWSAMHMALEDLERASDFDVLPPSVGPHVVLEPGKRVPDSVLDPARWVELSILPQRLVRAEDQAERPPRAMNRDKQGDKFFRAFGVQQYVRKHFDGSALDLHPLSTPHISHWVPGKSELLLMEPIVFRENLSAELRGISTTFFAWKGILADRPNLRFPHFIAYVLPGPRPGVVTEAREVLEDSKAEVIDISVPKERARFVETIRTVGRTATQQGNLL